MAVSRPPYYRRRAFHTNGVLAEYKWDLVERATESSARRATDRVIGTIERESYPTCRGGSEVVGWTATDLNGRRHLCSRLGDAVSALSKATS